MTPTNFEKIFEMCGGCYLILSPDSPKFTIVAVSDAYQLATHTNRKDIVGRGLFEIFPDNPKDKTADGVSNLTASLHRVLEKKKLDFMAIQRYDIPASRTGNGSEFEVRYWIPDNAPILDENEDVLYIVHHVMDATENEQLIRKYGGAESAEIHEAVKELSQMDRLNKIMVDRELKMVELKKELAEFKAKAGE